MSLVLINSPDRPTIKTMGLSAGLSSKEVMYIDGGSLPVDEFLGVVAREICKNPFQAEDPLLKFIRSASQATEIDGSERMFLGKLCPGVCLDIPYPSYDLKTNLAGEIVEVAEGINLSRFDLCCAAYYVLTNTYLTESDTRRDFIDFAKHVSIEETVKGIVVKAGDGIHSKMIETPAPIMLGSNPFGSFAFDPTFRPSD